MIRDVYANTARTGFTIDFFGLVQASPKVALLAAPFFTTYEPIEELTKKGCSVRLIVRLCEATKPNALKAAIDDPRVTIRYYTDQKFHAKLYIIDDAALVGSANLTKNGLQANREVGITLFRCRDAAFEALPGIFDELWEYADTLTPDIQKAFSKIYAKSSVTLARNTFEKELAEVVNAVAPPSVTVGSKKISKQRGFLQSFRRKYDEVLIPFHQELMEHAEVAGFGRLEYRGSDPQIEMSRFLGWVRLIHGANDKWRETDLIDWKQRKARIAHYVNEWQTDEGTVVREMEEAENELNRIAVIKNDLRDREKLASMNYDDVFDALCGCHAFTEQLRFTKGGLEGFREDFRLRNHIEKIRETLSYLIHGGGDEIERAYDCIFKERFRLERFGESCVMELVGWVSDARPPFNNRSIRGMRLLGYDVEMHVAGS